MRELVKAVTWLGHASFRLEGERIVYIDPWQLRGGPSADLILVTHDHHDHLSPEDIAKIDDKDPLILCPASCLPALEGARTHTMDIGDVFATEGVRVEAVAAYNPGKRFHPQGARYLGYVVELEGVRYYHAGDTDVIPEMADISCDVAFLPIGGTYTMTAEQAAEAVSLIKPRVVVPMHWGRLVGSREDAERLATLLPPEVTLAILEAES
ncbi:MAG: MBL fold metallo-hydrolase [Anaerolineae bacterium]|jgi:L-ascorbate metabolism protein UlaG (beta-lactamase superfamily)|nr:MBL fold metallo-hydrolase [Chloroflexota bacterium]